MDAKRMMLGMMAIGCSTLLWAAETGTKPAAGDDKVAALGAKRAQALQEVQRMQNALNAISPLQTAGNSIRNVYEDANRSISKALQDENAKAQEMRNQGLIDTANDRQQTLNKLNNQWNQETLPELTVRWNEISRKAAALNTLAQSVFGMDQQWMQAGLDSQVLSVTLESITSKAQELQSEIADLAEDARKQVSPFQDFAKEQKL